jgi:hypothetical protein
VSTWWFLPRFSLGSWDYIVWIVYLLLDMRELVLIFRSLLLGFHGLTVGKLVQMGESTIIFKELIHMEHWIGILGGIFYEGWTEYLQYLIFSIDNGIHEASRASTLQDNIMEVGASLLSDWFGTQGSLSVSVWCSLLIACLRWHCLRTNNLWEGMTVMSPFSDSLIMQLELLQEV